LLEAMEKDDLATLEKLGIGKTTDLTWKMLFDAYSCTECGRCAMYCPTVLTGKPLEHRKLNLDLKHAVWADRQALLSGAADKLEALPELVSEGEGARVSPDTIWACTTCGSCEEECPVFIENIPRIIDMRKKQVMSEQVPSELQRAFRGLEQNQNPWGLGSDQRDEWAKDLDVTRMADVPEGSEPPLLYWVGCAGAYDDRGKKISAAMVKILKAAGVPFAILGQEEACTGDSARRAGNELLFQMLAKQNIETLNRYKVKRILAHCPHCLHTIKTEYPQLGGDFEVVHHSELIAELLAQGKLKLSGNPVGRIALHDSCYLGRYHNLYEAPRKVVAALPGATPVELSRHESRAVCCGAGGARFWMEEKLGERINVHRAKEVVAAKPQTLASACPFCLVMLRDGIADLNQDEAIKTADLAELVAAAL
jgi:Fe-S oxidoreductase